MFSSTLSWAFVSQAASNSSPLFFSGAGRFGYAAAARRRVSALGFSSTVSSLPFTPSPFGPVRSAGPVVVVWVAA